MTQKKEVKMKGREDFSSKTYRYTLDLWFIISQLV